MAFIPSTEDQRVSAKSYIKSYIMLTIEAPFMNKDNITMKILIAVLLLVNIVSPARVLADDSDPTEDQYVETGKDQKQDNEIIPSEDNAVVEET